MLRRDMCRGLAVGVLMLVVIGGSQVGQSKDIQPPSPLPPQPEKANAKTYLLRYRFRPNQVVRYEVTQSAKITTVRGEYKQVDEHNLKEQKHFVVTTVDDKQNAILEPMLDAAKMSHKRDGKTKASYDSETDKTPPPLFSGVAMSVGKPLVQLKVSPRGRLLKAVSLLSTKVQKKVVKNAGPNRDPNDPSKNFMIRMPEKPVAVGEKWYDSDLIVPLQVDRTLNLWKDYTILRTYRLVSVKDDLATIELSMASTKPIKNPKLQVQMIQRLLDGTIVFNLKTGQIVSRRLSLDNKVFGFAGARSVLRVTTERKERLVTARQTADSRTKRKAD